MFFFLILFPSLLSVLTLFFLCLNIDEEKKMYLRLEEKQASLVEIKIKTDNKAIAKKI
jgi:hypothetical protein